MLAAALTVSRAGGDVFLHAEISCDALVQRHLRQVDMNNRPHLSVMWHKDTVTRQALCELVSESYRLLPRLAAKSFVRLHLCAFGARRQCNKLVEGEPHTLAHLLLHFFAKVFMDILFGKRSNNIASRASKFGIRANNFLNNLLVHFRCCSEGQHCFSVVVRCWPSGLPVGASVC